MKTMRDAMTPTNRAKFVLVYIISGVTLLGSACGQSGGKAIPNASPSVELDARQDTVDEPDTQVDLAGQPDQFGQVDLVDEGPPTPTTGLIGEPCQGGRDCMQALCLNVGDTWPGGYCSESSCETKLDCSDDASCLIGGLTRTSSNICVDACQQDNECRAGYTCINTAQGFSACLPSELFRPDGAACTDSEQCAGGSCAIVEAGEGFCTFTQCEDDAECSVGISGKAPGSCILIREDLSLCGSLCQLDSDCQENFSCLDFSEDVGICSPGDRTPLDTQGHPFNITCETPNPALGTSSIEYTVAQDTTSYMVVPFGQNNKLIYVSTIEQNGEVLVDLNGPHAFQAYPTILRHPFNPIVVPASTQYAQQFRTGTHTLTFKTRADKVCIYLLEESTPGTTLDLNVYLVGPPGITKNNAPNNANLARVYELINELFAQTGVSISKIRYFELTPEQTTRYKVIRERADLKDLVALSKVPGTTQDDALSLNVFLVESFALGNLLGLSQGLPGTAGLHGTSNSGVIFPAEYLGTMVDNVDGNLLTAQIMAHELGHYLGLLHTSESNGLNFDPLLDTPQCRNITAPESCEDVSNLMFPFSFGVHDELSPGQISSIQANPLTKD